MAISAPPPTAPAARRPVSASPEAEVPVRAAAAAGDRAAFATLYRTYRDGIYRYLFRRCRGDRHLAEDLTHDTFIRALSRLDGYRETGRPFGAWLQTIAGNLLTDYWRSGWHRYQLPCHDFTGDTAAGPLELADEPGADPESAVAASEWRHHVTRTLGAAIARLSQRQQQVLALRYAQGKSVGDTAALLGVDEGAVKAAAYRARQALVRDPSLRDLR